MPDFLTAALEEAYASAPVGRIIFHTLEINHLSFAAPVRLVANKETDLSAKLEATAPSNPDETVTFSAVGFDFVEPGFDSKGQPTSAKVRIDNVSGQIASLMKLTRVGSHAVSVIYRAYRSDGLLAPGQVIKGLELSKVRITATTAEAEIAFPEVATQNFPRQVYDVDRFPALYAN